MLSTPWHSGIVRTTSSTSTSRTKSTSPQQHQQRVRDFECISTILLSPSHSAVQSCASLSFQTVVNLIVKGVLCTRTFILTLTTNGSLGYLNGDQENQGFRDGLQVSARFNEPSGVAFLPGHAKALVADKGNHAIRLVTLSDGNVSTLAGNGSNGMRNGQGKQATFGSPFGIAVSEEGIAFVARAEEDNSCIRRVDTAGVVTLLAGSLHQEKGYVDGTGSTARFFAPCGLTLDEDDNVLVCDAGNNCIRKVTASGVVTTVAGCQNRHCRCGGGENFVDGNECREARFHHPVALCTFSKYTLVCDNGNNDIRMIADGRVKTLVGRPYQGRRRGVGMSTKNEKDVPEGHAVSDGEDDNDVKDDNDSVRGNTTWHLDRPVVIGIDSRRRPLIAEDTDDDSQLYLKEILVSLDWSFVRVVLAGLLKCQAPRSRGEREGQMVRKREEGVNSGDAGCYFAMLPQDALHTSAILTTIIRMAWFPV